MKKNRRGKVINLPLGRPRYVWAYGIYPETGKGHVFGPYKSFQEARDRTRGQGLENVQAWEFPTRNRSRAAQMIRHKVMEKQGLGRALDRFRHKPPNPETPRRPAQDDDSDLGDDEEE